MTPNDHTFQFIPVQRTPEENERFIANPVCQDYSTKLLQKNNFHLLGTIWDKEDGDVLEWEYKQ